jgi:hypothetical protein
MRVRTICFGIGCLGLLLGGGLSPLQAQQSEKRADVEFWPVGKAEEPSVRPWDPYTLSFSIELGGQVVQNLTGNKDVYDSHLNYRDGFKVFNFNLEGQGNENAFFDNFYVRGGGWVNEPYSWLYYGFSKKKWFDFRASLREHEYTWFFPGFVRNQHFNASERRLQDYKITFFPGYRARLKLGYTRNSSFGPTFTTIDFSRGEFPGFEPLRQTYDEYTIGGEVNIQRWLLVGEYGYRQFRNDRFVTIFDTPRPYLPNDPADRASFDDFERLFPARTRVPFFRVNLVGRPHKTLEVNTRLVYSRAKSPYTRTENFSGTTFSQGPTNPSTTITEEQFAFGRSIRPITTFDGNVTWRPIRRFTLTNTFQFRGYDIAGFNDEERVITCGNAVTAGCPLNTTTSTSATQNLFTNTFFDFDTLQNRLEASYDLTDWFTLRGGFVYLDRTWRFFDFESQAEGGVTFSEDDRSERVDTINRSWLAGLTLRPNKRIQIFFDLEDGNNTRVFNRQGPADLNRYRLRGRFQPWDGIRFNASWFIFENQNFNAPIPNPVFLNTCVPSSTNPAVFPAGDPTFPATCGDSVNVSSVPPEDLAGRHTSRNRGMSVDFQLARWERGYLDAGYSRNDITAITDVTIPVKASPNPYASTVFAYILNDNYWYIDGGGRVVGKFYMDAGYRLVDSTGSFPPSDPVGACVPFTVQQCDNAALDPFLIFSGGVKYHQPHLGVRYSFNDNVNWKAGWRYYDYNQRGGTFSDYNVHIITTSVILNF